MYRRLLCELLSNRRQQGLAVREPVGVGAEADVVDQLGEADALAKLCEEPVVRGRDHELAVLRREHLVRRDERKCRAVATRHVSGLERVRQLVADEREPGLEQRYVDLAAAAALRALVQRGDDSERCPDARAAVDQRRPHPDAGAVGLARDADDAGERLHERVVPGPVGERTAPTEGADRAVDEALVPGAQHVAAEAEPLRGTRTHRLDEDVGAVDQPQQRLQTLVALDVQCERALRRVRREEHHAAAVVEPRSPGPGFVSPLRVLDLHDVRPECAEDLGTRRAGERRRQVDDANPAQRRKVHRRRP